MKKVMVFGTFDGVHEGHRNFLRQAKECGDELVVAVAPDAVVAMLKKSAPTHSLQERIDALKKEDIADHVVSGDEKTGTWEVIREHAPNVIALGYDQEKLGAALEWARLTHGFTFEIRRMSAHHPEKYRSSLLNKN